MYRLGLSREQGLGEIPSKSAHLLDSNKMHGVSIKWFSISDYRPLYHAVLVLHVYQAV